MKPSPRPLTSENMDEDFVRKENSEKLDQAKDSIIEVIMKNNHTLGKNPRNANRRYEMAREEIDKDIKLKLLVSKS